MISWFHEVLDTVKRGSMSVSKPVSYLLAMVAVVALWMPGPARSERLAKQNTPVLVELFTSEGCSSCPPADRLLRTLETQKIAGAEVIVLSEHVDYWDYLGWRDPFSNAQFSKRQSDYGLMFKNNGIYTPQMIVNGRVEFVGNDPRLAEKEITASVGRPVATVRVSTLSLETPDRGKHVATVQLVVGDLPQTSPKDELEVMLAVTETGLRSKPKDGENHNRELEHTGVVRTLVKAGRVEAPGFAAKVKVPLDPSWKRSSLRVVAFVQERKSRIVWGAAQSTLELSRP
jgi:hypothetical protein